MPSDQHDAVGRLTFGQIEGFDPLPKQLKRGEITRKLRARLYSLYEPLIDSFIHHSALGQAYFTNIGRSFFSSYFVDIRGEFSDKHLADPRDTKTVIRGVFYSGTFVEIFNFIHFSLQFFDTIPNQLRRLDDVLKEELCAYRIVEGRRFVLVASQQDAETITNALSLTSKSGAIGARTHIRNSIDLLNNGDFAGSIRESISSVESVAKLLSSDNKSSLSGALGKLEKSSNIHGALKAGFLQLYGYTSDEKGIRHALIDSDKPNVDETDALFMIGACSAFVTYLINRATDADMSVSASE